MKHQRKHWPYGNKRSVNNVEKKYNFIHKNLVKVPLERIWLKLHNFYTDCFISILDEIAGVLGNV